MNRKLILVMVAVVATVLPAVAVADVMVVGYSGGTGVQVSPLFYIQHGSNYITAQQTTGFKWTSNMESSTEYLGNMTIGIMNNETIEEINVLDINFTSTVAGTFNMTIDVTSPFPVGSAIFFNETAWTFNSLPHLGAKTTSTCEPTSYKTTSAWGYVLLSSNGMQPTLTFKDVSAGTTIYVAFVIGSGSAQSPHGQSSPSLTMAMDYTVS